MSKLSDTIIGYLKENNLDLSDLKDLLKKTEIEVLDDLLDHDKKYVIKKSGNIEEYDPAKIERSIRNATHTSKQILNSSDIDIIMVDLSKKLDGLDRKIYRTSEIKKFVGEALLDEGYKLVYENYIAYIEED